MPANEIKQRAMECHEKWLIFEKQKRNTHKHSVYLFIIHLAVVVLLLLLLLLLIHFCLPSVCLEINSTNFWLPIEQQQQQQRRRRHHLPFCMYTIINLWPEAMYSTFIVCKIFSSVRMNTIRLSVFFRPVYVFWALSKTHHRHKTVKLVNFNFFGIMLFKLCHVLCTSYIDWNFCLPNCRHTDGNSGHSPHFPIEFGFPFFRFVFH